MNRVLITGGQGFLGAWIAKRLLREAAGVTLLDLKPDEHILAQVLEPDEIERLERRFGDIAAEDTVARALDASRADTVIHLAALQVPACRADPVAGARTNVIGTLRVFEAVKERRPAVRNVVYASSAAVAGAPEDYPDRIPDGAHHHPRTHYGVFKLTNEGNARVYFLDHGIPSVGLRPLTVYGVGREIGITSGPTLAIRAAVRGEPYTVPFRGVTGFNYVEDVAEIFVEAARKDFEDALALNLPGEPLSVEEFIACIEREVPEARGKIRCEGAPLPVAWNFSDEGLRSFLGRIPRTPPAEGVRRTAARFRELLERGIL